MAFQAVSTKSLESRRVTKYIKSEVSRILVRYASDNISPRPHLTQQLIADMIGIDSDEVKEALYSLKKEGLINLEHLRIVIKKELFQKVAG